MRRRKESISDLFLFKCIYKYDKIFTVGATMFCSPYSKELMNSVIKHKKHIKKYVFTETTNKRVDLVPIDDKVFTSKFYDILFEMKEEAALICLPNKLHFIYTINKNSISMLIGKGELKKTATNPDAEIMNNISGAVHINLTSDGETTIYTNSIIDVFANGDSMLHYDPTCAEELKVLKNNPERIKEHQKHYDRKRSDVEKCLKAFIFIKYAKVYDATIVSLDSKVRNRFKLSLKDSEVIKVDSFWDTNIEVINPFGVGGHFRNQPIGERGKGAKKLIYIDSFMKNGYIRKATILKQSS